MPIYLRDELGNHLTDDLGNWLIAGYDNNTPVTVTIVVHDNGKHHVKMIGY